MKPFLPFLLPTKDDLAIFRAIDDRVPGWDQTICKSEDNDAWVMVMAAEHTCKAGGLQPNMHTTLAYQGITDFTGL